MSTLQNNRGMTYEGCSIPLHSLITFPQTRKTFDFFSLKELADDFSINGMLQPPIVAKLSRENFILYKETFEAIYEVELPSIETYPMFEGYYYCLIAGERRYRGHIVLWQHGCTACNTAALEKGVALTPGQCYHSHFRSNLIEVRSCFEISPLVAKSIQFRENNHERPPAHELADDYQKYFRYLKRFKKKVTLRDFAKKVGVSEEKVRRALWFCELPEVVQEAVRSKKISHSHGLVFKKIMDAKMEEKKKISFMEDELRYLRARPKTKFEDFKERIDQRLELLTTGYGDLFGEIQSPENKKQVIRKVVAKDTLPFIIMFTKYMRELSDKEREKIIGKGKLYSEGSPNHQVPVIAGLLEKLFPDFTFTKKQMKIIASREFGKPSEEVSISQIKAAQSA